MTLRLMLWLLSVMLKRARRRKAPFRDALAELGHLDWGIGTEDLSIARHYRMTPARITSGPGLPVDLDLELRFEDAATAVKVLRKPTSRAFREGLIDGRLRLVGDSGDLAKLQRLLSRL